MSNNGYIRIPRFIDQLNECFDRNDKAGARKCLEFWESEARSLQDDNGLLTVLNEEVGFFRRSGEEIPAMNALTESLELVEKLGLSEDISGATVYINAATTLCAFGRVEDSPKLYENAASVFETENKKDTYEYAALLNNRAAAYYALKRYDEAEKDYRSAIEILDRRGYHAGEIAISLLMIAHIADEKGAGEDPAEKTAGSGETGNCDPESGKLSEEQVERLLDEAWEYINSDDQPKDGRYADVLLKCAPSFDYFGRDIEALACRETADEIYSTGTEDGEF